MEYLLKNKRYNSNLTAIFKVLSKKKTSNIKVFNEKQVRFLISSTKKSKVFNVYG